MSERLMFKPLNDRVLVRRADAETVTKGGILLPDNATEKPVEGVVVAVGPGAVDSMGVMRATTLRAGERIAFGKWSGTEMTIDGEDLLVMKEGDVFGVYRDDDKF